jgi:hypothetical protein
MSKPNRLSHSACNKFQQCPKAYQYHYIDKLRSTVTSSALIFGSAIDLALGAMLEDHKNNNLDILGQAYESVFVRNWRRGKVNNVEVDLFDNPDIVYAAADLDIKLFNQKDWMQILSAGQNIYLGINAFKGITPEAIMATYDLVLAEKEAKGWDNLPVNARKFYNYVNWLCLTKKGILMLEAYRTEVLPKIKKVLAIQKEINISNDSGDSIIGYIDLVAEMDDGKVYVLDNKTAARAYDWDAVEKSTQLALYVHAVENEYNTRHAGFIVLGKAIDKNLVKTCAFCKKDLSGSRVKTCDEMLQNGLPSKMYRCGGEIQEVAHPKATVQILLGTIPDQVDTLVMENMMDINAAIKTEVFPRNLNACDKPFPCQFKSLCWKNSMQNLVDTKEKE